MPAVIFDFDGTIVDSDHLIDVSIVEVCALLGRCDLVEALNGSLYRHNRFSLFEQVRALMTPFDYENFFALVNSRFSAYDSTIEVFSGIRTIIADLHNEGFALGIFTGSTRQRTIHHLRRLHLDCYFSVLATSDEFEPKPDPQGLNHLLQHFQMAAGRDFLTAYVGNSLDDKAAAIAVGVPFVGVAFCSRTLTPLTASDCTLVSCIPALASTVHQAMTRIDL